MLPSRYQSRLLVAIVLFAGCTERQSPPSTSAIEFTTRDSAGIEIVENGPPVWTEAARWRVAGQPSLHIGEGTDGDPSKQFASITGVHRLSSGGIAVVDPWSLVVSFFDSTGVPLGRAGRRGRGPGEFPPQSIWGSFSCGSDTVYVMVDRNTMAFAPPDRHVRTFSMTPLPRPFACNGSRLLGGGRHSNGPTEEGITIDSMQLAWFDLTGSPPSIVDTLPAETREWMKGPEGVGYTRLIFSGTLSVTATSTSMATGFGDRFEIEVRDSTGEPVRIIRVSGLERVVDRAAIARLREYRDPWPGNAAERARFESRVAEARGRPLPAFGELRLDSEGNIWAREYDHLDAVSFYDESEYVRGMKRARHEEPRRWNVLQADGRYLGVVETPPRFIVHEIGRDYILGMWRDEFDIPYVRKYPLIKP